MKREEIYLGGEKKLGVTGHMLERKSYRIQMDFLVRIPSRKKTESLPCLPHQVDKLSTK